VQQGALIGPQTAAGVVELAVGVAQVLFILAELSAVGAVRLPIGGDFRHVALDLAAAGITVHVLPQGALIATQIVPRRVEACEVASHLAAIGTHRLPVGSHVSSRLGELGRISVCAAAAAAVSEPPSIRPLVAAQVVASGIEIAVIAAQIVLIPADLAAISLVRLPVGIHLGKVLLYLAGTGVAVHIVPQCALVAAQIVPRRVEIARVAAQLLTSARYGLPIGSHIGGSLRQLGRVSASASASVPVSIHEPPGIRPFVMAQVVASGIEIAIIAAQIVLIFADLAAIPLVRLPVGIQLGEILLQLAGVSARQVFPQRAEVLAERLPIGLHLAHRARQSLTVLAAGRLVAMNILAIVMHVVVLMGMMRSAGSVAACMKAPGV